MLQPAKFTTGSPQVDGVGVPLVMSAGINVRGKNQVLM